MLVPMTKVRILGPRSAAKAVLGQLHRLGLVELADARTAHSLGGLDSAGTHSARSEELRLVLAQTDTLLAEWSAESSSAGAASSPGRPLDLPGLRMELTSLAPGVEEAGRRLDALRDDQLVLPSYLEPLRSLLPARDGSRRPRCGEAAADRVGHGGGRAQHR